MALPALSAVNEGYRVFAVPDASGTYAPEAAIATMMRLTQAGVVITDAGAVLAELQRTWHTHKPTPGLRFGAVFSQTIACC